MISEVREVRQRTATNQVLHETHNQQSNEEPEEPGPMVEEVPAEIRPRSVWARKYHYSKHEEDNRLKENDRKLEEVPFGMVPHSVHRPPGLYMDKKEESSPGNSRSVGLKALPLFQPPSEAQQQVSYPQPKHD